MKLQKVMLLKSRLSLQEKFNFEQYNSPEFRQGSGLLRMALHNLIGPVLINRIWHYAVCPKIS